MEKTQNMFPRYAISYVCSLVLYWVAMCVGNARHVTMLNFEAIGGSQTELVGKIEESLLFISCVAVAAVIFSAISALLVTFLTDKSKRAVGIGMILLSVVHGYLAFILLDGLNFFENFGNTWLSMWM